MDKLNLKSEYWQLIKIKKDNIYVLVNFQENIDSVENIEELKIRIIPFVDLLTHYVSYNYRKSDIWSVQINLYTKNVTFAEYKVFEIEPNLRNKGLGSYVLYKLVDWVKKYPSDFKVSLWAKSIDSDYPNNHFLVERLYQKFNLLKAQTISDIKISPPSNKIEIIETNEHLEDIMQKFIHKMMHKNNLLENENHRIKDRLREVWYKYIEMIEKKNLAIKILVAIIISLVLPILITS